MLNNGIMLFNKENGLFKFKRLFQADEAEKKKFVSVPDKDFRNLVKQGQVFLHSIVCKYVGFFLISEFPIPCQRFFEKK